MAKATKKEDATVDKTEDEETQEDQQEESTEQSDESDNAGTTDDLDESADDKDDDSKEESDKEDADDDEEKEAEATVISEDQLKKMISNASTKAVRAALRSTEKVDKKEVGAPAVVDSGDKYDKMSPALRTVKHLKAYVDGDRETLRELNEWSQKEVKTWEDESLRQKAGYASEGIAADGSVLVPPADFVAEVARLEAEYGVARANGVKTRTVNSNAVTINKKTGGGLAFVETNEAAAKTGVKMAFAQQSVTLRKFAAIAPVTDELVEDAAVDIFNELTTDFSRAKAFRDDQLVFTDASTGIIEQSGLALAQSVHASAFTGNVTFDHILKAIWAVPNQVHSSGNAKFYCHRGAISALQQIKDSQGRYILVPNPSDGPGSMSLYGFPVVITEVLVGDDTAGIGSNNPFIDQAGQTYVVFGDLSNSLLIDKGGLDLTVLTEGTVTGSDSGSINLAQQDMKALRGVYRANNVVQFPYGFSTIGTGVVS